MGNEATTTKSPEQEQAEKENLSKLETFDLKNTIAKHLETIKPIEATPTPTNGEAGQVDIDSEEKKETPPPTPHPYDKVEDDPNKKDKEPVDDGKGFGSKMKAFLANGQMFVGMLSGFTEIALNTILTWSYKKQVDPDEELDELPLVRAEALQLERTILTDENKQVVAAQKSALMDRILSIEQKVDKIKKYTEDIQFTENEKEVLKAVFEHKFSGTQLAEYVDKYPVAAVIIGIVLPRVFPVGQEAFKKYTS